MSPPVVHFSNHLQDFCGVNQLQDTGDRQAVSPAWLTAAVPYNR